MKVLEVAFVEDCLDGTALRDIVLDQAVDSALIDRLASHGQLDRYDHFPIPYFRGTVAAVGVMGTKGSTTFRIVLPARDRDAALHALTRIVEASG